MELRCKYYDPLTHPKYTIGGCAGCGHCKIYSDGDIICVLKHGIVEMIVPDLVADSFDCEGYELKSVVMSGLGCLSCKHYDYKKEKCLKDYKPRSLYVRLF